MDAGSSEIAQRTVDAVGDPEERLGIAGRERRPERRDPDRSLLGEGGGQFVEKLTVAADAAQQGVNIEKEALARSCCLLKQAGDQALVHRIVLRREHRDRDPSPLTVAWSRRPSFTWVSAASGRGSRHVASLLNLVGVRRAA